MPKYVRTQSFLCCALTASLAIARPYPGIPGLAATAEIPGVGSLKGEFNSRDTLLFQIGVNLGSL